MEHRVLNARYHEEEASIVAQAGVPGAVTIATNMAGRGTDIQLGGNLDMILEQKLTDDMSDFEREQKTEEITADIDFLERRRRLRRAGFMFWEQSVMKAAGLIISCAAGRAAKAIRDAPNSISPWKMTCCGFSAAKSSKP